MIALSIEDIRDFTSKLFLKETFDSFELVEADFNTDFSVSLDGHLTEPEKGQCYAGWSRVKPLAFQVIKGNRLPHRFHIVLRLSDSNMANTIKSTGFSYSVEEVGGLYINIQYQSRKLTVITGCSFQTFTLDRSLEKEWDRIMQRFLRHHKIPFSIE
ncbi:MAG: DUF5721 family protein [Clostridiales bacterium]|nr:DUF5721 family protein [Clostridiales bacterium]